jgi:hypothetical protein
MSYPSDGMSKPKLSLRDWLFGAGGKRRLLEAIVASEGRAWTEAELARASGLHAKGSVDVHVRALVQIGMLGEERKLYRLVQSHPLVVPLRALLMAVAAIEDTDIRRPPLHPDA